MATRSAPNALSVWLRRLTKRDPGRVKRIVFRDSLAGLAAEYLRGFYRAKVERDFYGVQTAPEWFDHRSDLYRFSELRSPHWVERGLYSHELMTPGCRVLDLCCGDGFYAFHFYAETAAHVDAVDYDAGAIAHARRWHAHPRIVFHRLNATADPFPGTDYDVIAWDGAIEHFGYDEILTVLRKVKVALAPGGVLCGYAIVAGTLYRPSDHSFEFESADELRALLREHFGHVRTLVTRYPERHNIYFRASDDEARLGGWE